MTWHADSAELRLLLMAGVREQTQLHVRLICSEPCAQHRECSLTCNLLQACDGSLERAADWLFSHADDLDAAVAEAQSAAAGSTPAAGGSRLPMHQQLQWRSSDTSTVGQGLQTRRLHHTGANSNNVILLPKASAVHLIDAGAAAGSAAPKTLDGPGRYSLLGFVSHMGASTAAGHYVAHIRKDGRWVIYNDEKVWRCGFVSLVDQFWSTMMYAC
jgi:Ubiquitin carboxyl-terminal hydrolase